MSSNKPSSRLAGVTGVPLAPASGNCETPFLDARFSTSAV